MKYAGITRDAAHSINPFISDMNQTYTLESCADAVRLLGLLLSSGPVSNQVSVADLTGAIACALEYEAEQPDGGSPKG